MHNSARERIKAALERELPLPAGLEPHLRQSLRRVLENPGSLIRPEIVLQMGVAYALPEPAAIQLAVALEYFHSASLLFDDLPSMDDAAERRGVPCIHVDFGDASAILAALALVNRAYALSWRAAAAALPEQQPQALAYLERNLGVHGLLNGQSLDLHYARLPHDQRTTERVAMGKTVSLIRLTLVLPAILGGASARELQLLDRVAVFWGLSYQIVDDLKDVLQSSRESGKTAARDQQMQRPNLALVLGVAAAADRLQALLSRGDRSLERALQLQPGLSFLQRMRNELGREAAVLMERACAPAVSAAA